MIINDVVIVILVGREEVEEDVKGEEGTHHIVQVLQVRREVLRERKRVRGNEASYHDEPISINFIIILTRRRSDRSIS